MIQQSEFEKLEFNPFVLKKNERMVNKYPNLNRINGFADAEDTLVRYRLVKLKGNKEEIFSLKDEKALELVTGFLIYKGNMQWHLLCSTEQAFYQNNKLIMSPESKNKLKLINESEELKDKVHDYYNTLFGDDKKIKEKAKRLASTVEDYTPEGIANNV
jgi:hypothetical protein